MLEISHLSKTFGAFKAVNDVSFLLRAGTITGLIGPNGAGKTTLFDTIAGRYRPSKGSISFLGRQIGGIPPHRIFREGLVRTFQIPRPFAAMTVLENLMLVPTGQAGERLWNNWFAQSTVHAQEVACRERAQDLTNAFGKLGGTVTQNVVYNPSQPSYRAEVDKAIKPTPDALLLIGYPGDGTTIAREWISAGGTQAFLLPDGLESQDFVNDVGAQYMKNVHGTAPGSVTTPSLETFQQEYKQKYGDLPTQAYIPNAYDGTVLVGLAMSYSGKANGTAIRDSLRKVTDPHGEKIYAGEAQLKKAVKLIAEKKPIQYIGASGPLQFDQNGDINAPMVVWSVDSSGKVKPTGMVTVEEIDKLQARVKH